MTGQAAKCGVPCSLLFISLIMASVLGSCDRETAEREPLSVVQSGQTDQKQSSEPVWVVDPANPGPDMPPVGRSLFDYLVTAENGGQMRYKVPFPFAALVRRIEEELGAGNQSSRLKGVLIPPEPLASETRGQAGIFQIPKSRHRS